MLMENVFISVMLVFKLSIFCLGNKNGPVNLVNVNFFIRVVDRAQGFG